MREKQAATADQVKAVSSATRVRIMRLCHDREWTNKQLADRLELDPSTVLHHVRILEQAGLVESTPVRQGPSGAYEKPYRSTGLSWQLILDDALIDEDGSGEPAPLNAFRQELLEAGVDSAVELTRFMIHLDDDDLAKFVEEFTTLIDRFVETDSRRAELGAPGYGAFFAVHRLRES